jgi:hypothetical protein
VLQIRLSKAQSAASGPLRLSHLPLWRRVGLIITVLAVGLLFFTSAQNVQADPPPSVSHLYLYNGGNPPIEVTSQCFVSGGQVYLYPNNPVHIVLDYDAGHIYDDYSVQIGYFLMSPPD